MAKMGFRFPPMPSTTYVAFILKIFLISLKFLSKNFLMWAFFQKIMTLNHTKN